MTSLSGAATPPGDAFLVAARGVRLARVKGKWVLFSAVNQLLFVISDFAAAIWPDLQAGLPLEQFSRVANEAGPGGEDILPSLLENGVVRFLETDAERAILTAHAHVQLGDVVVLIGFGGPRAEAAFRDSFSHLEALPGPSVAHLLVLESPDGIGSCACGETPDWVKWKHAAVALKEVLTEIALQRSDRTGLHAATLSRNDEALLLFGPPGAGKSTLAAALGVSGFRLDGDDIALLQLDGRVRALHFPTTLKSKSWPLLATRYPELNQLEIYERSDGQSVRYLKPPNPGAPAPRRARMIVQLDRAKSEPSLLQAIPIEQALAVALDGGWSRDDRLSLEAFGALMACMETAACFRLQYSDLDGAISTLGEAWDDARRTPGPETSRIQTMR